jgi:hypothetical protein
MTQGSIRNTHRFRGRLVLLAATLSLAIAPAAAQAMTVSGTAAPVNPQAGANSDVNININLGPAGEDVKDLTVGLPPGLAADPTATPKCTAAQLATASAGNDGCPANTRVGAVVVNATITVIALPVTLDVSGNLYNFTAQPGEPARFAIVLQPGDLGLPVTFPLPLDPVVLQSGAELRQTDFGLNSVINNIPNSTPSPLGDLPTHINSQQLTLFGIAPGTGKPFARNPTSCTPKVVEFTAVPYAGATGTGTSAPPFTPTGCGSLPFAPKFSADVTVSGDLEPGSKPTVTTVITQTPAEAGLRDAKVFVPLDLGADVNQILPGEICSPAQFQARTCPAHTRVGSALATSPFLTSPLTGSVYVVDNPGEVAQIGLDLRGELSMLIRGQLALDNSSTFTNLPDIPISRFALTFDGGPDGLLSATRDICRPPAPVFQTRFVGHNGASIASSTDAVVNGCGPLRKPKVRIRVSRAGSEHPSMTVKVSSASGFERLRRVKLKLPGALRFTGGASGDIVARAKGERLGKSATRASGRVLKLKLPSHGLNKVKVKVGGDALRRNGGLGGRVRFTAKVTDTDGAKTSLKERVRPKG